MVLKTRIDGRYEIREVIGHGGMGIVYKAYDSQRNGYVALKTMKDAADPAALALFTQEWHTLANISHPNIVDVLSSGEFAEQGERKPYFVMPLLPGMPLDKLIRDKGHRLTVDRVVEIISQTCRGLQAAHTHGLIHRDLKPSNIFVMDDDSVKIIDFGMVHLADAMKSVTGIKGTLQYMAPEQLELKEITPATDIFSLGVVAYEALTGRKPFDRGNDAATAYAIRSEFPAAASDLNSAVRKPLAQVIAKAMAKGPWNRFTNAREFAQNLQRAWAGEPIEAFEFARIQPRVERARKALLDGDFDYASEILTELQLEGHVDAEISLVLEEVKEAARTKLIRQLLDSARTRLKEEEFPLAWQKVQEALQKDPGNREAQALQAEIDTRRSDQQVEKWRRLVQQHLHNNAFTQARQAIEEIRKLKHDDQDVSDLIRVADRREKEFQDACNEKERQFQSAMRADSTGEISTAVSKLEKILELDGRTPGFVFPGRDEVYRENYEKIRSEWESVQHASADIEKAIAGGDLGRAAQLAEEQAAKYPNDVGLQAHKLKIEELQRQERSAYIAEVGRRTDAEPDLDRAVKYLEEAIEKYPKEPHFEELASGLRKRRDFVNAIVTRARQYEDQNLCNEALSQWKTLRSVHPQYPGVDFEIERVDRRCEQHKRDEARLNWVDRIDRLLQADEYAKADDLATDALVAFPGDQELQTLKRLSAEGKARSSEAIALTEQARKLASEHRFEEAVKLLRAATELDQANTAIRDSLADVLAAQAQAFLDQNQWRSADSLIQEAARLAPAHTLVKSLRLSVSLARRNEFIDQCVANARDLQASNDISGALAKVQEGLTAYPNDGRLVQLQNTLRKTISDEANARRKRDLEELQLLSKEADHARDQTSLTALLERSVELSRFYPGDAEVSRVVGKIQKARVAPQVPVVDTLKPEPASSASNIRPTKTSFNSVQSKLVDMAAAGRTSLLSAWARFKRRSQVLWNRAAVSQEKGSSVEGTRKRSWLGNLDRTKQSIIAGCAAIILFAFIVTGRIGGKKTEEALVSTSTTPISVAVNVSGAKLFVDGKVLERDATNVEAGPHTLSATKIGYKPAQEEVKVGTAPENFKLTLAPEPHIIRIAADVPSARVLLDGAEVGVLSDGEFTYELIGGGRHTIKLIAGRNEMFSAEFQADPGRPIRLVTPLSTQDVPVVLVSNLGAGTILQSSVTGMEASSKGGERQLLPADGLEMELSPGNNVVTFDDGKKPVMMPVEIGNAPILSIRAGSASRGTLLIEANVDADVYINGRKSRRPMRQGRWVQQVEPSDYRVHIALDGYDASAERKVTVASGKSSSEKFELAPSVTTAFLRIERGTPDATVIVDGRPLDKLDASGALGPAPVSADTEHSIHIEKKDYEPLEWRRRGAAKETITISGADAQLKPFATLLIEVKPPDARVTIRRRGENGRLIAERTLHLRQGAYTVSATNGNAPVEKEVTLGPGQRQTVTLEVPRKSEPVVAAAPPKRVEAPDLFPPNTKWTTDSAGFALHEGTVWLTRIHFTHILDVLKIKKTFGRQEKVKWRIYTQGDDYLECELDGTNLSTREINDGKAQEWVRKPHGLSEGNSYRLKLSVQPDQVTQQVGKASQVLQKNIEGRTGFVGKFGLRLVE